MNGSNYDPYWTEAVAAPVETVWSRQRLQDAAT